MLGVLLVVAAVLSSSALVAQEGAAPEEIPLFHEYDPPSTLVVPENQVKRSKFPFIDVHNHQQGHSAAQLEKLVAEMDKLNMAIMVNLSGRGFRRVRNEDGSFRFGLQEPSYLKGSLDSIAENTPGRVVLFTNFDAGGLDEPGWTERTVAQLEEDVRNGAPGPQDLQEPGHGL